MYVFLVKIFFLFFLLLANSCKINPKYSVTGVILEKNSSDRIMLIDHDEIPGFMDPMVMNFKIHKTVIMENFSILDSVQFDLVILEGGHHSINFKTLGKRKVNNNDDDFFDDTNDLYTKKDIGEVFDNVSFTKTDNSIYNLYENNKDYTIISYIFSRCPIPEMCPAIVSTNIYLANTFKNYNNIDFLILSFDYVFDTPNILFDKYGNIEKNNYNIKFLSSSNHYNDLILLTKQSDVTFGGIEENNIGHTMRTIILDKDKKLIKSYSGFDWRPGDLKTFLFSYMDLAQ